MDLEREDKIITHFLESIGIWKNYIVIGGGYAPIIYKLYFSDPDSGVAPVGTRDIDSLIPRKIPKASKENISEHLKHAGFNKTHKGYENPPIESYLKDVEDVEIEIEFLTDNCVRKDREKNIEISGVVAQPLTYLSMSIANSIPFTTFNGLEGLVVSPEAWVFHKGLTFVKRKDLSKSTKDLYGIWYVLTQIGDFSKSSIHGFISLSKEYPSWSRKFKGNITKWIDRASPKDWDRLQSQDPSGKLKELSYQKLMKEILK